MGDVDRVAVIGAGDMGHGFAVQFVRSGVDVTLIDHRQSNLDRARERIRSAAAFLDGEGLADLDPEGLVETVEFTLDRAAGVAGADLVLETVPEEMATKQEMFGALAGEADDDAVLSSNTSGLPITEIAEGAPEAADRIVGCHWWYPPYLLRPVEVIPGAETSDRTVDRLRGFLEQVDRDPVMVQRDVPGFVWNRVQHAVVRECLHIVEEGIASAEDVNRAIRDGYATRTAAIGPLETVDIAGLELFRTGAEGVYPHLCDRDDPNPTYDERIAEGRTGIDAGAGIFDYDRDPDAITRDRDERVAAVRRALEERERERERENESDGDGEGAGGE